MNLFNINFDEIYRRHLCRHAEFGINLLHIIAVVGIYYCLASLLDAASLLIGEQYRMVPMAIVLVIYFGVLSINIPIRVLVPTIVVIAGVLAPIYFVVTAHGWLVLIYLAAIIGLHQFQQWSHKVYTLHRDMSEFAEKYPKGMPLFILLAVYELPILLNYLLYGRKDWVTTREPSQT